MMVAWSLSPAARDSLTRLAESSDRASPSVFAGRDDEMRLLNAAARGAQRGETGHTIVIEGVPGAGKTALLNEYATCLLVSNGNLENPIIPVPLRPGDLDVPPAAILQAIDKQFRAFETAGEWSSRMNRMAAGASLAGNTLFAAFAKRKFDDFRPSAKAPHSLHIALDDYVAFRLDRHESTIVLLVDEAQNLNDTAWVRTHLDALHGGIVGRTQVVLACFGLANTTDHLRELGLSRLATDHVRSLGSLSYAEAKRAVTGTLDIALADCTFQDGPFDEVQRESWIAAAARAILSESANFPHHLANGCRALAQIVLDEGIADVPPTDKLQERCRDHKRMYYDARLRPWARHMTALAQTFGSGSGGGGGGWTPLDAIIPALMASDDFGKPVDEESATTVIEELCASGYIEKGLGEFRPVLPSLASHFEAVQLNLTPHNTVARTVRAALPEHSRRQPHGTRR